MKAFGIVMFVFGCLVAVGGLFGMSEIDATSAWVCQPDSTAGNTYCAYRGSDFGSDPGTASRQEGVGIGIVVVGAGLIAGGLACAGAARGTSRPSVAPGVGGPAYAGAAAGGQPGPVAFGSGQSVYGQSPPPPASSETGQQGQPPTYGSGR